jgi:pimeloyl-ACP methyl ester carboxylesterase
MLEPVASASTINSATTTSAGSNSDPIIGDAPLRTVRANGVDICTQAFGDPRHPALLMVMGANASMLRYPLGFCEMLAARGRYVIRYDNRDTGQSTTYPPGEPPYTVPDMARDAVGVLDAYEISRAHVLGFSLGGLIVQHLALDHRARIITGIPMCTSPDPAAIAAASQGSHEDGLLPPPTAEMMKIIERVAATDWTDPAASVEAWVAEDRIINGSVHPFDERFSRATVNTEIRRARNLVSQRSNHPVAIHKTPAWRHRLGGIRTPMLVIHGPDDPCFPLAHGQALAAAIPEARLLVFPGLGHSLAAPNWPRLVDEIIAHTSAR